MRNGTTESAVRGLLAAVVIYITWSLARGGGAIADQWQAVFLMVIGYYFKDRPQAEKFGSQIFESGEAAWLVFAELTSQFVIALALLVATAALFATTGRNEIAGAWIGGVALAIAFYFKDATTSGTTVTHNLYRAGLAFAMGAATLWVYLARDGEANVDPLPLQWIALAFVVIGFFFKERGGVQSAPLSTTPVSPTPTVSAPDAA